MSLAKGYPFEAPRESYLYAGGESFPLSHALSSGGELSELLRHRTAVIAHGSNRAPAQLARKFLRHDAGDAPIPVTAVWLRDHDVVYSAHVTRYGSIAAELIHAPGVEVQIFVTWLTDDQLLRMHETELPSENYNYGRIHCEWSSADGLELPSDEVDLSVYRSTAGALNHAGAPVSLAAIPARNRWRESWHQTEVLQHVHARHGDQQDLDSGILKTIENANYRKRLTKLLRGEALKVPHPGFMISL